MRKAPGGGRGHEIGHAIGVDHLNVSGAVMAPYVSPSQQFGGLTAPDVDAALSLYGPATTAAPSDTTPPAAVTDDAVGDKDSPHDPPDEIDDTAETDTSDTNRHWRRWRNSPTPISTTQGPRLSLLCSQRWGMFLY